MIDATLTIAQIAAPPRPQQSVQSDTGSDARGGNSDFGAVLQSSIDDQPAAPTKSNPAKSSDQPGTVNTQNDKASGESEGAATASAAEPSGNGKSASPKKSPKTNATDTEAKTGDKADDKKAIATEANILLALQPQSVSSSPPKPGELGAPAASCDAQPSSAAPASAADQASATPQSPLQAGIAAAPAQIPLATAPVGKSATAAEIKGSQQANGELTSKGQKPAAILADTGAKAATPGGEGAAQILQMTSQNAAAETTPAPAVPAADKSASAGSGATETSQKTNNSKAEIAAANANALLPIVAAPGAPETGATSGTSEDKTATAAIASPAVQGTPADKPQPAAANAAVPKLNAGQEPFNLKANEIPAPQTQANSAQPAHALSGAAPTPTDQNAATNGQTPAQPAATSAPAQGQAFITANIAQPPAAAANSATTLHAQMDGPRFTLPTDQIALEIRRHQFAGSDHFSFKIDPPELGRIDVKIETTSDGQTKAHLTADRQDTLDMLQRDSGHLERALNGNGLKTDKDSLNFSLRQDSQSGRGGNGAGDGTSQGRGSAANGYNGSDEDLIDIAPVYTRIADPTRVDILI